MRWNNGHLAAQVVNSTEAAENLLQTQGFSRRENSWRKNDRGGYVVATIKPTVDGRYQIMRQWHRAG